MTLTVSGNQDLDTLEGWVREKFTPIENKNVQRPDLGDPEPYRPQDLGKFVKYVPITDDDQLVLMWILPYLENEITTQPLQYFSTLYGNEGENSLLSYLAS